MIIEIATAAAMYLAENATTTAAQSDIPQMISPAALCRYKDPQKLRQCLNAKMRPEPDPYAAMWNPNWISTVTPVREGEQKSGSAKATNPNLGSSKGAVASKPHTRSH